MACLPSGLRVEHDTTVAQNWRSGENEEGNKMTNSHEAALSDNSYLYEMKGAKIKGLLNPSCVKILDAQVRSC